MNENLTWRAARDLLLAQIEPLGPERLPLSAAAGRRLGECVTARWDVPPFDRSPYDGYAFRASDTKGKLPVTLTILEEVAAGSQSRKTVVPGTAIKILTGAPIPPGADAVTKFEETDFTPETVTLHRPYNSGESIIRRGEDVAVGMTLAQPGQVVDAGLAGGLASQGILEVSVYPVPRVGILTTGSELAEGTQVPGAAKIPNSNRYALEAALTLLGCQPQFYGAPGDDVDAIADGISRALEECDLVVTTGGVSVGDYDLTPAAVQKAGAELLIQNLRLKPGGKSCFGRKGKKLVTCLSGNPASAMTCFYAVVAPLLRRLQGSPEPRQREVTARLDAPFKKGSKQPRLVRGRLETREGELIFVPAPQQGNGALHTLAGANAFADLNAGCGPLEAGAVVRVCCMEE